MGFFNGQNIRIFSFFAILFTMIFPGSSSADAADLQISLQQIKTDFKGKFCYVHARGAVTPDGRAIITTQPLFLKGTDVFYGLEMLQSSDAGKSWSKIKKSQTLVREKYGKDYERVMCDATPFYHKKSGKLLIIGQSAVYSNNSLAKRPRPRHTLWSIFDPEKNDWEKFRELRMPDDKLFFSCGAGSTQCVELDNGDLLVPVYAASAEELAKVPFCYKALVLKCSFDGKELKLKEIGKEFSINVPRGLCEPSAVEFNGNFFLALRNDKDGYVSRSRDGLNYEPVKNLCFDDGKSVGNYCTQQHWLTLGGKLYMVYTRRGGNNDHVFRHRAPLFIAQFDPDRLCLIRSTEMIAVPERGARLGNFGCVQISENEAWVIAAEWMQTTPPDSKDYTKCMKYGSDNSIWIAKIKISPEKR